MATPLSTRRPSRVRYQFVPWHLAVVALAVLALAIVVIGARMLAGATFVPRLEVVNNSEYAVDLDVTSGGAHDGWMGVGVAKARGTTTFEDVYDQGKTWTLRFGVQGRTSELTVPRDDLERAKWRVRVPDGFAAQLRDVGVSPTPAPTSP
jgi:hypothetical protein